MFIEYHQDQQLIPEGTKTWAEVIVKTGNTDKDPFITQSKNNPETYYLLLELYLIDPDYKRKKFYYYLGRKGSKLDEKGNDKYKRMGDNDLVKMICAINGINIAEYLEKKNTNTPLKFMLEKDYSNLGNNNVFVEIGVEPAKKFNDKDYPESNKIKSFIIPNKEQLQELKELTGEEARDEIPF